MGWFSRNDWNVIAIIFERSALYSVFGQRAKGGDAEKARDGARFHPRCICWAVFDQKRKLLEVGQGPGAMQVAGESSRRLEKDLPGNMSVQDILTLLESGKEKKGSKPLVWGGYPKKPVVQDEEDFR